MTDEEIARLERLAAGYAGPESDVIVQLLTALKEARAENESKESALLKSQEWVRRLTEESDQQKAKIAAMEEASTRIEEYTVHGCTGAERKCTIVLSQCNCGLTQARKDLSTAKGMPS